MPMSSGSPYFRDERIHPFSVDRNFRNCTFCKSPAPRCVKTMLPWASSNTKVGVAVTLKDWATSLSTSKAVGNANASGCALT